MAKKYLCGISVKKDTTSWNLAVIPLIFFISGSFNFYTTTFLPLLLQHEDYFDIPKSELGQATALVLLWS